MGNEPGDTARSLTQNFAETTSMHGVSRIIGKPGIVRRFFWVLAVLGGAGVAIFNIWKVFMAFSRNEVSTVVSLEYNSKLSFPAVTICNLNPIKLSEYTNSYFLQDLKQTLTDNQQNATTLDYYTDWETPTNESYYDYDDRHKTIMDIHQWIAKLPRRQKLEIGHSKLDMILDCTFQGRTCSPRNFIRFYNYMHGNCYSFNAVGSSLENVIKTGPLYGLSVTLYSEEHEYISTLTSGVGFKVVVHNSSVMPFPEDEGFDISPGFVNSIGVTKVEIERTPVPYGRCVQYGYGASLPPNIFTTELDYVGYSDTSCERTCFQQKLLLRCGCCDTRYPCTPEARRIIVEDQLPWNGFCDTKSDPSSKMEQCANELLAQYENNTLGCRNMCALNCRDESHQLEISTALWPPSGKVNTLAKAILKKAKKTRIKLTINENSTHEENEVFVRRNTLRLDVYYKQLNYEKIETRPAYDWSRLLSDVGGQAGLWLGFSLLTLGEIVELLLDIAITLVAKCCRSKKDSVKPLH